MPGAGSSGLRNIVKIKIQFKGLLISNNSGMTRSVRRGILGLLLLGLIGAAFADMKTTSAEAEVKNMLLSRASKTTVPASGTLCTFRDLKWQSRDSHLPK